MDILLICMTLLLGLLKLYLDKFPHIVNSMCYLNVLIKFYLRRNKLGQDLLDSQIRIFLLLYPCKSCLDSLVGILLLPQLQNWDSYKKVRKIEFHCLYKVKD